MKRDVILYFILTVLLVLLASGTAVRNTVYYSGLSLWKDCAEKNNMEDMRSLISYATFLSNEGQYEKAWEITKKAMTLKWEKRRFTIKNLRYLAQSAANHVSREDALELFQFIYELSPNTHYGLGFIVWKYYSEGDLENARISASLMNRLFNHPEARGTMGEIYHLYGCYDVAEKSYLQALAIEPNNPKWNDRIVKNSLYSKSEEEFKKDLKIYGGKLLSESLLLYNSLYSDSYDQADLHTYAAHFYNMGCYEKAELCLEKYIPQSGGLNTLTPNILVKLAALYHNLENFRRAEEIITYAVNVNPDNRDTLMFAGYFFSERGEWDKSLDMYTRIANTDNSEDPEFSYVLKRKIKAVKRMKKIDSE